MSVELAWGASLLAGAAGGLIALASAAAVARGPRGALPRTRLVDHGSPAMTESARDKRGAPTASRLPPGSTVVGYVTEPSDRGDGDRPESSSAIEAICERCGWQLLEIVRDPDEGPTIDRARLRYALELIASGMARGLVVADLLRITRSIVDLGALMAWFREAEAALIALDLDLDTSTPEGRHVADTLIALSARDHQRIATATRRGLAKGRASGHPSGRPAVSDRPELVARIASMRAANMTLRAIADQLNSEDVPTPRGGKKWRPSSIQAALGYQRPGPRDHLPPPHTRVDP